MNVRAVGAVSPDQPDPLLRTTDAAGAVAGVHAVAASGGLGEDFIETFLQDLARPQVSELYGLIEQARLAQDPVLLQGLLRTAVAAVSVQDTPSAITTITKLITLNPERGAQMVNDEAALMPIRGEIQSLLRRLSLGAKLQAEQTLAAASLAIQTEAPGAEPASSSAELSANSAATPASSPVPLAHFDPRNVLEIAQQLLETGQHINFVRAEELGQVIIGFYQAPVFEPEFEIEAAAALEKALLRRRSSVTESLADPLQVWWRPRRAIEVLKVIWRRGPLLVVLVGWLSLGLAGGLLYYLFGLHSGQQQTSPVAFEIWAVGFLFLVIFQFLVTTRKARF